MKRTISNLRAVAILLLVSTGAGIALYAQDAPKQEVTLGDVVVALEKINAQLEAKDKEAESANRKTVSVGGGPRFDFRYFPDMPAMNGYLADRGSYDAFDSWFMPMVNSGGGTYRFVLDKNWQIGWNSLGGGFSNLGFKKANAVDTIDQDADGYDDYYSYAGYGISINDFLLQYKFAVLPNTFYIGVGGLVGLGNEGFSIEQNERSFVEGAISAITGSSDWSRMLLDTGAYLTMQFQPGRESKWFKLSMSAGFDYPIAFTGWAPSAGVHKDESAPPEAFKPMNAWVGIGLDFNF